MREKAKVQRQAEPPAPVIAEVATSVKTDIPTEPALFDINQIPTVNIPKPEKKKKEPLPIVGDVMLTEVGKPHTKERIISFPIEKLAKAYYVSFWYTISLKSKTIPPHVFFSEFLASTMNLEPTIETLKQMGAIRETVFKLIQQIDDEKQRIGHVSRNAETGAQISGQKQHGSNIPAAKGKSKTAVKLKRKGGKK